MPAWLSCFEHQNGGCDSRTAERSVRNRWLEISMIRDSGNDEVWLWTVLNKSHNWIVIPMPRTCNLSKKIIPYKLHGATPRHENSGNSGGRSCAIYSMSCRRVMVKATVPRWRCTLWRAAVNWCRTVIVTHVVRVKGERAVRQYFEWNYDVSLWLCSHQMTNGKQTLKCWWYAFVRYESVACNGSSPCHCHGVSLKVGTTTPVVRLWSWPNKEIM